MGGSAGRGCLYALSGPGDFQPGDWRGVSERYPRERQQRGSGGVVSAVYGKGAGPGRVAVAQRVGVAEVFKAADKRRSTRINFFVFHPRSSVFIGGLTVFPHPVRTTVLEKIQIGCHWGRLQPAAGFSPPGGGPQR